MVNKEDSHPNQGAEFLSRSDFVYVFARDDRNAGITPRWRVPLLHNMIYLAYSHRCHSDSMFSKEL